MILRLQANLICQKQVLLMPVQELYGTKSQSAYLIWQIRFVRSYMVLRLQTNLICQKQDLLMPVHKLHGMKLQSAYLILFVWRFFHCYFF